MKILHICCGEFSNDLMMILVDVKERKGDCTFYYVTKLFLLLAVLNFSDSNQTTQIVIHKITAQQTFILSILVYLARESISKKQKNSAKFHEEIPLGEKRKKQSKSLAEGEREKEGKIKMVKGTPDKIPLCR